VPSILIAQSRYALLSAMQWGNFSAIFFGQ
jgi:hypothetical protein